MRTPDIVLLLGTVDYSGPLDREQRRERIRKLKRLEKIEEEVRQSAHKRELIRV